MTYTPDICIYHDNCDDGFAAALVVWKECDDFCEYRPAQYNKPPPIEGIDGQHVLIVDFSFPKEVLKDMAKRAASVVVLDHHKTARDDLEDLMWMPGLNIDTWNEHLGQFDFSNARGGPLIADFDMERSGARMTWDFFHPGKPVPLLIQYVEDRDLWWNYLPHSKEISLWIRSHARDFGTWENLMVRMNIDFQGCIDEAVAIKRFYDIRIAAIADTATLRTFAGHENVAVVHTNYDFVSDVGHTLLDRHPDASFAVMIVDSYGDRSYSLRSTDDREDVSTIAKKYGGGGHRNAAGFRMPL